MNKITEWQWDKIIQYVSTTLIVLSFCALLFFVCTKSIPEPNKETANLLLGALAAMVSTLINYYYGSSKGGRENRDTLNAITDKLTDAATQNKP